MIAPNEGQASCHLVDESQPDADAAVIALAPAAPMPADPAPVAEEQPAADQAGADESAASDDAADIPVENEPEAERGEDAEETELADAPQAAVVASAEPAPRCAPGSYSLTGFTPCLPCPDGVDCSAAGTSLQALRAPREGARF